LILLTTKDRLLRKVARCICLLDGEAYIELVVWFDYVIPEDPSQGHIRDSGAIDIPDIRECIKKVMWGGEEAFELRRQKYGF
jgi:hypothetical protein